MNEGFESIIAETFSIERVDFKKKVAVLTFPLLHSQFSFPLSKSVLFIPLIAGILKAQDEGTI
jgi:hypothetical protein